MKKLPSSSSRIGAANKDRRFDLLVDGKLLAAEELSGDKRPQFIDKRYRIPADVLAAAKKER